MIRAQESQSLLVPIPSGHTENILECPSYGKSTRIPVFIGPIPLVPIPLGHTENILECPSYGKSTRIPVFIGPNTIGTY